MVSQGPVQQSFIAIFGDASNNAHATAAYLVSEISDKETHSILIFSKTRVRPLNMESSIPRLQLLAALITARVAKYLRGALHVQDIYCFTDSTITLAHIKNGLANYKQWVEHRIKEILLNTQSKQWFFIPTAQNPSDIASRGSDILHLLSDQL